MNTLSLRTWVRNAAAVFSGCYGSVTRQAEQAGCSPRKDFSPYQALGLELPSYDFWELLRSDAETLTQELSTSRNRA